MNAIVTEASSSTEAEGRHLETTPSHNILYVEDDPALRSLSANLLLKSDYRVEVAEDGQQDGRPCGSAAMTF